MGAFGPHRKHFVELRRVDSESLYCFQDVVPTAKATAAFKVGFRTATGMDVSSLHSELRRCFCVAEGRVRSSVFLTEQHKVFQVRRTGCASPTGVSEVSGLVLCARLH